MRQLNVQKEETNGNSVAQNHKSQRSWIKKLFSKSLKTQSNIAYFHSSSAVLRNKSSNTIVVSPLICLKHFITFCLEDLILKGQCFS